MQFSVELPLIIFLVISIKYSVIHASQVIVQTEKSQSGSEISGNSIEPSFVVMTLWLRYDTSGLRIKKCGTKGSSANRELYMMFRNILWTTELYTWLKSASCLYRIEKGSIVFNLQFTPNAYLKFDVSDLKTGNSDSGRRFFELVNPKLNQAYHFVHILHVQYPTEIGKIGVHINYPISVNCENLVWSDALLDAESEKFTGVHDEIIKQITMATKNTEYDQYLKKLELMYFYLKRGFTWVLLYTELSETTVTSNNVRKTLRSLLKNGSRCARPSPFVVVRKGSWKRPTPQDLTKSIPLPNSMNNEKVTIDGLMLQGGKPIPWMRKFSNRDSMEYQENRQAVLSQINEMQREMKISFLEDTIQVDRFYESRDGTRAVVVFFLNETWDTERVDLAQRITSSLIEKAQTQPVALSDLQVTEITFQGFLLSEDRLQSWTDDFMVDYSEQYTNTKDLVIKQINDVLSKIQIPFVHQNVEFDRFEKTGHWTKSVVYTYLPNRWINRYGGKKSLIQLIKRVMVDQKQSDGMSPDNIEITI